MFRCAQHDTLRGGSRQLALTSFQTWTRRTVIGLSVVVFLAAVAFAHYSTLAPPKARENPWSLAV